MSSPNLLHTVKISVAPQLVEIIDTALELPDISVSRWESADGSELRFDIFFDSRADAEKLASTLKNLLDQFAEKQYRKIEIETIKNKNWQDAWKDFFYVERISEHIVIKPSHEDYEPQPGDCVINIDPGMSFGTGQHATTKSCLQFLDKLNSEKKDNQPQSFLDLGCGSGILSIAAAKLGYSPIKALDIDPDSVIIAGENFEANAVRDLIEVSAGDVSKLSLPQTYDIVAANILAVVLMANAEKIAAAVSNSPGYLLLAGILTEQYPQVRDIYKKLGFKEIGTTTEKEWTGGYFVRS